jgi:hypothetical protein
VRSLTFEASRTLRTTYNSFIMCRIDYCNSLLTGLPKWFLDRWQAVLNASAKLICGRLKYDHATPLLRDKLHWLPVQQRNEFKLCLLTFKALHGMVPQYIADFAVRRLRRILVIVFDQRHTATSKFERVVPSLAIGHSRLLVHAHGTSQAPGRHSTFCLRWFIQTKA